MFVCFLFFLFLSFFWGGGWSGGFCYQKQLFHFLWRSTTKAHDASLLDALLNSWRIHDFDLLFYLLSYVFTFFNSFSSQIFLRGTVSYLQYIFFGVFSLALTMLQLLTQFPLSEIKNKVNKNTTGKYFKKLKNYEQRSLCKRARVRCFSGRYCPVFGLTMKIYRVNLCIQFKYEKNMYQKNSKYVQFLRSSQGYLVMLYLGLIRLYFVWMRRPSYFSRSYAYEVFGTENAFSYIIYDKQVYIKFWVIENTVSTDLHETDRAICSVF